MYSAQYCGRPGTRGHGSTVELAGGGGGGGGGLLPLSTNPFGKPSITILESGEWQRAGQIPCPCIP